MTKLISNNYLAKFTNRNVDNPPQINPNENRNNNGLLKTALIGGGITAGALLGGRYLNRMNIKNLGNSVTENTKSYSQSKLPSSNDVTRMNQERMTVGTNEGTRRQNIPESFRANEAEVGIQGKESHPYEFITRKSEQGRNNGVVELKAQTQYGQYKKPNKIVTSIKEAGKAVKKAGESLYN